MEVEYEEVKVRVPKAVMELLRAFMDNVEEYLETVIVDNVASVLSEDLKEGEIVNIKRIVQKFNLKPIFEFYGATCYLPKDC